MKIVFVFAAVLGFASAGIIKSKTEIAVDNIKGRITNGEMAIKGQFPYQVGLSINKWGTEMWCGGSILSETWLVTAGHCSEGASRMTIYFGTIELGKAEVTRDVGMYNIFQHADFNPRYLNNDITLVKFPAITFSDTIQPIRLPAKSEKYSSYVGTEAVASGWGRDGFSEGAIEDLHYVNLEVLTNEKCANTFMKGMISPKSLCVATPFGKSTCHGDSGGPLVSVTKNILIGLTSFGSDECTDDKPAVFTRITSYLDWIKDITGISY